MRVLVARDPERARATIRALEGSGFEAATVQVTVSEPLENPGSLPDLSGFDWVAFTSRNAVASFVAALSREQRDLPGGVRLAAVGDATAEAAARALRRPDLVAGRATGAGLADALSALDGQHREPRRTRILWPCATRTTLGFADGLTRAGILLERWPCYATRAVDPGLVRHRLEALAPWHACVFAAPSGVRAFLAAWPLPWRFVAVAIGPTTGAALRDAGVRNMVISASPRAGALAEAVEVAVERFGHGGLSP